jgi:hypothetical protein
LVWQATLFPRRLRREDLRTAPFTVNFMSKNKINHYRLKFYADNRTLSFPRDTAIELISKSLTNPLMVRPTHFDNTKLSTEHLQTVIEFARLWKKLTELENTVKERTKKAKTKG